MFGFMKNIPFFAAPAVLLAAAVVFRFCMRGYDFIGYGCAFAAAVIVLNRFLPSRIRCVMFILIAAGLVYFIIAEIPVIKSARTDAGAETAYVIVLGAAVHGDMPSIALTNRLKATEKFLSSCPDAIVIVSGGQGAGENISEAQCMKQWLIEKGIDGSRIYLEDKSTSTYENLLYSYDIIRTLGGEPDGKTAISSSPYHLYRAKYISAGLGVKATGIAASGDYPLCAVNYFIREAFAVTKLWLLGAE